MRELHNTYIDSACNYIVHALNTQSKLMDKRHAALNRTLIVISSVFVLLALAFTASATDYYVATWGSNSNSGNLAHPWQNVSYATQQATAGDTINLFDGTWYNEECTFTNDGDATHHIILTAYNGTPTLDGMNTSYNCLNVANHPYIDMNNVKIMNYINIGIRALYSHHVNTTNVTVDNCDYAVYYSATNYSIIDRCTFTNAGWSTIQISAEAKPINNITISNNFLNQSIDHGHIDLCVTTGMQDINITGNTLKYAGSDTMGSREKAYGHWAIIRMNISDNVFINNVSNPTGLGINSLACTDTIFHNNSFRDYNSYAVKLYGYNVTSTDNVFMNNSGIDYRFELNTLYGSGIGFTSENDSFDEFQARDGEMVITDPYRKCFTVLPYDNSDVVVEYTDGTVFTAEKKTGSGSYLLSDVVQYPSCSNATIDATSYAGCAFSITASNITIRPTYGHLYDVTVDTWDEASGTYRITASSTEPDNPTWINLTTKAASTTYNIKRDDESYDTQATTSADGVLRYRCNDAWDGPRTFEFSYASGGVDPAPCVTDLRNGVPTQQTVTLFWGCSVSDIDHYTIYKNGVLLDTTESPYYSVTDLLPDTPYTFSVSATTTDGITSETATLSVQTAAEEAEDFGSNTVHIADDVTAAHGGSVTVPIMIHNATGVACAGVALTYDASVVTVTHVTGGCFTSYIDFDEGHVADGQMILNTYINGTQLTGEAKVADVTFVAVGEAGDTSPLDMEIIAMADQDGYPVTGIVSNGLFTVVSDTSPPIATDPSASQLIPDDTDGVPLWGETATLNITVTDESDIASVTIDLSAIGGSPVQPMTPIGGNVWSVTTSASAGTSPQTYELQVCATDIHGYTNMSESVELVVMRNGDVTGDGDVKLDDVKLLGNCVTHSDRQILSSEFVADVTGDGVVDIADAMLLANHVVRPDRYTLR